MDWYEKIKSMSYKELAEFLVDFNAEEITSDYCENACKEKSENGYCKHKDCIVEDYSIIEKWLHLYAEND
jgi:hypothetical protein